MVNSFGRPWTEDGFRTSWDKAFRKTSLKDLRFHDQRGTAVTRRSFSNCSVPEIASITGHSMITLQEILDAHYWVVASSSRSQRLRSSARCMDINEFGMWTDPGEGAPRSPRLLRERALHATGKRGNRCGHPTFFWQRRQKGCARMANNFLKPDIKPKGPF